MDNSYLAQNYFSEATRDNGSVLAEATESATESADTAITGPTFFLLFTALALIAFAVFRFTPLYKKEFVR